MPSLILYAVIFLAVAGVIGGAYHTVKKSGYTEAEAEYKPKLDQCTGEIEKQNAAVAALAAESARKAQAASQALAKAKVSAKVWEDDAARLRAALTGRKPSDPQDCKAAWATIRGGK